MATSNLKPQSVIPQEKVRTLPNVRNESPEQPMRRACLNFGTLEDDLKAIHAISDVLDYAGEVCQGQGEAARAIGSD